MTIIMFEVLQQLIICDDLLESVVGICGAELEDGGIVETFRVIMVKCLNNAEAHIVPSLEGNER